MKLGGNMEFRKIENIPTEVFEEYYSSISGGIDGYYEQVILNADSYEVVEEDQLAVFTINEDRGLTSLIVKEKYNNIYDEIFLYVVNLSVVNNMMFSDKDKKYLDAMNRYNIPYYLQSYNFGVSENIDSLLYMKKTSPTDIGEILSSFGDFIRYNNMDLADIESFYYKENDKMICFGAIEELKLVKNIYCISMIVNEEYRRKGYGTETIKFLISYLQKNGNDVNARCYFKNESSKKTLLRSGMVITNRVYVGKRQ